MRNVRCAGLPFEQQGPHAAQTTAPCGWKGERFPKAGDYPWDHWFTEAVQKQYYAEQTEAILAKPCPRCGGRVELIPQEP